MSPTVSVVVPVYNASRTIDRCVNSILKQSYSNLDIILVNDGSLDNSGELCESFALMDERVKTFHQKNAGPSAARNTGINKAMGKYIVFVDCDDYIPDNYILFMLEANEKCQGNNLIVSSIQIVNPKGFVHEERYSYDETDISVISKKDFLKLYGKGLYNSPVNKLYNRKELLSNNIMFKEGMHIAEDMLFNTDYFAKVCFDEIVVLNTNDYLYVRDGGVSLDNRYNPDYYINHKDVFEKLEKLAMEYKVSAEDMELLYTRYISIIERTLEDVNHPECKLSGTEKKKRNNEILRDPVFRRALDNQKGKMSRGRVLAYKSGSMTLVNIFNKWSQFRNE